MARAVIDFARRSGFDDAPRVHHVDPVGVARDDSEICVMMISAAPSRRVSSFISSRICAWMVTSSAVVGSSAMISLGPQDKRHGDHDALAHAAAEMMGYCRSRRSGSEMPTMSRSSIGAPLGGLLRHREMLLDRFGELKPDRQDRVQRGHRLLKDHADLPAAHLADVLLAQGEKIAAIEANPPETMRPGGSG